MWERWPCPNCKTKDGPGWVKPWEPCPHCGASREPCDAAGKHPYRPLFPHGPKDATSNARSLGAAWRKKPSGNIGIATGLGSGIWCLDVDLKSGGAESLRRLLAAHDPGGPWEQWDLADGADPSEFFEAAVSHFGTATVRTGSGGLHFYFRYHSTAKTHTNAFAYAGYVGIDVRSEGGHVVAPPSGHVSGGKYTWLREPFDAPRWDPHAYGHLAKPEDYLEGDIKRAPEWLLEMLADERCGKRSAQNGPIDGLALRNAPGYQVPDVVLKGDRDSALASHAGYLRVLGMNRDAVYEKLVQFDAERCQPPKGKAACRRVADSICKHPPGNAVEKPPPVEPEAVPVAPHEMAKRRAEASPEPIPPVLAGQVPDDPEESEREGSRLETRSDRNGDSGTEPRREFTFRTYGQVLRLPPKEFLIRGVLGKGDQAALVGGSKQGKTLVVLDMAAALVRGDPHLFANRFHIVAPIRVVYATGEGQSGIPNRFVALQHKHEFTEEQWARFIYCDNVPNLFRTDSPKRAELFASEFQNAYGEDGLRGGLLIIDTYARAISGGNENSAQDTTIVQDTLGEMQRQFGCTILVLLHTPHTAERIRGSTNIQASFDSVLKVREENGVRLFGPDVSKDCDDFDDVAYAIRAHTFKDEAEAEHRGAFIEWLDDMAAKTKPKSKDKRARASAEISRLLQEWAKGEEAAVPIKTILEWLQESVSRPLASEIMHDFTTDPTTVFRGKQAQTRDKRGHLNKEAWHYWAESEDE